MMVFLSVHMRVITMSAVALSALSACHSAPTATEATPPPGEVWLTPQQVTEAKVQITPVDDQNTDDTVLTSGKIQFDDSRVSHIFSPISGRITQIEGVLGQRVKKGDALCTIESPDIGVASSDLSKAQADMVAAEHDFKREKDLFEQHAASQRDFETSEDNYHKAKAELDRAMQRVKLMRSGSIDAVTQSYTVRAPIDGEVINRTVNPGMEVQGQYSVGSANELFTVGELDKVWVLANVFEMDLSRVKVGDDVSVKVVAYPNRVFTGKLDWVSGVLDPATRTATVRGTFDNTDRALKPEMYATVEISVDQKKALAIPRSALLRLGDQTVVFLDRGPTKDGHLERFERVPVGVDEKEGSKWLQIMSGLNKGDKIVTAGSILLVGML